MRVTYGHLKPIVKGSGPYHEIRWNVEFSGEHFERLREMDMRLQAVLGDTLDEDDGEENDSDDSSLFDFKPSPEEQITMAE
jgi:hypothetical protein